MSPSSVKRASPGHDEAKNGTLGINEEDNLKLVELAKQQHKLDILLGLFLHYFNKKRYIFFC